MLTAGKNDEPAIHSEMVCVYKNESALDNSKHNIGKFGFVMEE